MIQRQQSLWLLLSAISAFLTYKLPFFTGQLKDGKYDELIGGSNFFLLVLTGAALILALVTIFFFKDRKLQLRMAITGAVISVLLIVIYFTYTRSFLKGSISFSCVFTLAMLLGYIMAARGIWKDEKLVKSLDKLR
jgi:hypothetical protein